MFTVMAHDDLVVDYEVVFEGTLEECREYIAGDEFGETMFIEAEDGSVIE